MAREENFLLGRGEKLTTVIDVPSGGGPKEPPYSLDIARARMSTRLATALRLFSAIPDAATPDGNVVGVVTMHPRYTSKSDFPDDILRAVGLESLGSRSRLISPDQWGIKNPPARALTEELFVAGTRQSFQNWERQIQSRSTGSFAGPTLAHIEDFTALDPSTKLKSIPSEQRMITLEVVLHNGHRHGVVEAFVAYANFQGGEVLIKRRRDVGGLTFLPVRIQTGRVRALAEFTFLRVARAMPSMRPLNPGNVLRMATGEVFPLPSQGPLHDSFRAAVFDGGLPVTARAALAPWVNYIEPAGIGPAVSSAEEHGLAVTAALLFGPLESGQPLPVPMCAVDHVRVIDARTGANQDLDYLDALDRILQVLDQSGKKYQFVNFSLGPSLAVDDFEVTSWTAELDQRFAHGNVVATVAAGNDGNLQQDLGLHRIQPPADGVNVLSVGAATTRTDTWARAGYSCMGPGRSPGLIKPDGLAFGGSSEAPFLALTADLQATGTTGTSFAAPLALRGAVSVRAQLADNLLPLSIRALLIHRAQPATHERTEVGWGRFEENPNRLITCDDDETLVVYQGLLPVGSHLRAPIPLPNTSLPGKVWITGTLVIAPTVDPEHPGAYTRSGLEVAYRPHADKYGKPVDGKRPAHPKTRTFFSSAELYNAPEYVFRENGHKWEPCLRNTISCLGSSLKEPGFDIYYHNRESGQAVENAQPIPYAFIVSVKAPKVTNLYDRVVRAYANVLVPLRPQLRLTIKA